VRDAAAAVVAEAEADQPLGAVQEGHQPRVQELERRLSDERGENAEPAVASTLLSCYRAMGGLGAVRNDGQGVSDRREAV